MFYKWEIMDVLHKNVGLNPIKCTIKLINLDQGVKLDTLRPWIWDLEVFEKSKKVLMKDDSAVFVKEDNAFELENSNILNLFQYSPRFNLSHILWTCL